MTTSDQILERLLELHPKLIDLSLDRLRRLLAALGNPQDNLPRIIHIAGTNGKGSTLAFIHAMLEAAGYRVHVYTSPHLVRFHERIQLAGNEGAKPIGEADLARILAHCETVNAGAPITFFEITTAAAFQAFSQNRADFVLLETGLGGRFDATNVITGPALTIITPISHDHHEFLGDTLAKIAFEKAGILKPGIACVTGPQDDEALEVIEERAHALNAPLLEHGRDWQAFEQHGRLVYQDPSGLLDLPLPALSGHHQVENAGLAIAALRALDPEGLEENHISKGLKTARWPGRLERLTGGPLVQMVRHETEIWLDGGHNPAAGLVLGAAMARLEERASKPLCLILGMMGTKDAAGFLDPFKGLASLVVTLPIPGEPGATPASALRASAARLGLKCFTSETISAALALCDQSTAQPPRILIAGSLYLAGHVLRKNSGD